LSNAARRVRTRRCARSRIRPPPGERHDRGGRHALARLPAPAGVRCTRRSACGPSWLVRLAHLRSSSGTRTQAAHDSYRSRGGAPQFRDRLPGCPGPKVRNPPLLLRRLPGQGRGDRAREALRVLTETQVAQPRKVAAALPRLSTSNSRNWPPFEGTKRLSQNRGPAKVITSGGP
jgi:hypothetical protein